jgi:lipopolysaccharide/colanic/teichoic acid biosynthesis glycosyltransferase
LIAILVALGGNNSFEGLQDYLPVPLLPLADKPFLQHIVEYLASQGVRRFEFILSHLPERIEAAMGDGARWGCGFRYHLLPLGGDPMGLARTVAGGQQETIVLGTAECLPELDLAATPPGTLVSNEGAWTGWGILKSPDFSMPNFNGFNRVEAARCLSIKSGHAFLRSQKMILEGTFPGLIITGRQADPGIWVSRNVALHPTAKLTPPVYIGENSRIGKGAQIGPSAVIGPNCIIDAHTIIVDSMVAAGTFVGEGLELDSVIVDRNRLLNIRLETSLLASEAFLLGSLTGRSSNRGLYRALSMLTALVLLLLLWPVLLLTLLHAALTRTGAFKRKSAIRLPADDDPGNWQETGILDLRREGPRGRAGTLFLHFLPGLVSVLRGKLFLVGVHPRSRAQLLALPSDWRSLYLKTKAGLITEAEVMFGSNPSEDELYTAEAFYSATESIGHDCRLFGMWIWKTIAGSPESAKEPVKDLHQ